MERKNIPINSIKRDGINDDNFFSKSLFVLRGIKRNKEFFLRNEHISLDIFRYALDSNSLSGSSTLIFNNKIPAPPIREHHHSGGKNYLHGYYIKFIYAGSVVFDNDDVDFSVNLKTTELYNRSDENLNYNVDVGVRLEKLYAYANRMDSADWARYEINRIAKLVSKLDAVRNSLSEWNDSGFSMQATCNNIKCNEYRTEWEINEGHIMTQASRGLSVNEFINMLTCRVCKENSISISPNYPWTKISQDGAPLVRIP